MSCSLGPWLPPQRRKTDFSGWQVRSGSLLISFTEGLWWLCSWTYFSAWRQTFGSTAEGGRFLLLFAFRVFAEMSLQLAYPSDICPVSCHCLNYCLLDFISFLFLLNNPPCISASVKLALFHRILLAFAWSPNHHHVSKLVSTGCWLLLDTLNQH